KLSARWQGFSLEWYAKLFTDQALLSATVNSLIVATVSTVLAGALGVLTAVALERQPFRWQGAFEVLLLMPIVIPEIMMGVALLMAFTLSLDDFIISFFTAGVGSTTLPIKVYGMLKSAVTPEVNALSAILVLVSMGLVAVATWVQRK